MTIQKTLLASLITLAALSGVTHADTLTGALTELQAIQSGMSKEEINQKIQRFIERAPEGTNIDGVLADLGLTYTGPMASSAHQQTLVMPHLDAPVIDRSSHLDAPAIDRSSHLDSNVTQEQHGAAKAAAENLAAYRHNNPEGVPTHQTGPATHLDGTHQALVTPHLDAPVIDRSSHLDAPAIDRSSHLDSNVTQEQRDAAKAAAENLAAYRHNNPEGIPTHQTGPATHLDGTHQALVTPHLDAPVIDRSSHLDAPAIDRSSHLDSNVTQEQRDAAKAAAENLAAYRHNNPEGNPTHQIGPATHLDGTHQALVTPHLDAPVIDRSSHLDAPAIDRSSHLDAPAIDRSSHLDAPAIDRSSHLDASVIDRSSHLDAPATDRSSHLDAPVIDRSSHLDAPAIDRSSHLDTPAIDRSSHLDETTIDRSSHLDAPTIDRSSHLDAPAIDRSSHLDSNVTQEQRDAAKAAGKNLAAYRHNNPEGIPTHQTGPATHLDGTHQALVTPHLDAPVIDRSSHLDAPSIDRSSHLDSNVTKEQRDAAKAAAENLAAYRHNNPEGIPMHQADVTTQPETRQSSEQRLTAEKYASANTPHNGVDGKDGIDGKDGHSITGKTGAKGKDADMTLVNANVVALRGVRNEQAAQGAYIQQNSANVALNRARIASNSAAINQNSHDIAANRKDIDENTKDIKRVGAMAQAVSSLHYNRNESGYAVAAGEYDGEASIAGGMQFSTSQDSAVTMQVSWDGNATGAGVGFHSNF